MAVTWGSTVVHVRAEKEHCISQQAYVRHIYEIHVHDVSFSQVALATNLILALNDWPQGKW